MDSEHTMTISFEEDLFTLAENHGLYRARSLFKSRDSSPAAPLASPEEPEYLVTETEIGDSYLSASLSTIQPLGNHKSLLILTIVCHPAPGRRFANATITWRVSPPPVGASLTGTNSTNASHEKPTAVPSTVKIITLAPQHSVGGWTEEQTRILWGVSIPANVGVPGGSVGIEPSVERETNKAVMHAMTILGSLRGNNTRANWTVEENKSSERGIPSHFQFAIVVEHSGLLVSEFDVKAELGGGLWPTFVQAKKGKDGNGLKRVINVEKWKCGEVLWEPGELGWKKYVAGLTGEVPGVMLDFHQAVVRP